MANSKQKFIIKLRFLLFFCCALILFFTLAANIILALYKNKITQALNAHFFKTLTIQNIFYLPPNFIIFKEITVSQSSIKTDKEIFHISISCSPVSLTNLILNKNINIASLYCIGLTTDINDLTIFLKDNPAQILDFITHLPRQDFTLKIKQVTIKSSEKNMSPVKTKGEFNLKIKGEVVFAYGALGENAFDFKGILKQEQLTIENFKLNGEKINCQFWGTLNSGLAEFKGFILTGNLDPVKKFFTPDIFLTDIDSRIKFSFPLIEIEHLNFSINNNPVKATGQILLNQPLSCNLKLSAEYRGMNYQKKEALKNIFLTATITAQDNKISLSKATLNIDSSEQKKKSLPLEKVRLDVENLLFNLKGASVLKIAAGRLNLFSKTSANVYNINLEDFQSEIYGFDKALKVVKFSSRFYDGSLRGRGYIEIHQFIPIITAIAKIENVTADKLEGILIHFSKVHGKLSSQMSFINYPELIFKGTLYVHNGSLDNFEFFKWVANSFDLANLKKIPFNIASTDFIVNKEGAGMYNMDLDSEKIKISGYFKLKENDLVSSKIFFSLHRNVLQSSPKFVRLLKLLDPKQELIKFNFQLSGNLHRMNFQWLKSDFKDELQKTIPDFAKRNLEKQVGMIVESIQKE